MLAFFGNNEPQTQCTLSPLWERVASIADASRVRGH